MEESSCVECNAVIYEPNDGVRLPCPSRGSTKRSFRVPLEDRINFFDGYRLKGYRTGEKEFYIDERDGPSYFRMGNEWHHLIRIIDRENDIYVETIRELKSGKLIRHVQEKLSEHIGHGGAKNQEN